eukprot:95707-Rhodomonas_salina.3
MPAGSAGAGFCRRISVVQTAAHSVLHLVCGTNSDALRTASSLCAPALHLVRGTNRAALSTARAVQTEPLSVLHGSHWGPARPEREQAEASYCECQSVSCVMMGGGKRLQIPSIDP